MEQIDTLWCDKCVRLALCFKYLCTPNSYIEILTPKVTVIRRWDLESELGHENAHEIDYYP